MKYIKVKLDIKAVALASGIVWSVGLFFINLVDHHLTDDAARNIVF